MPLDAKTKAKFAALEKGASNKEAEPSKPVKKARKKAGAKAEPEAAKKTRKKRVSKKEAEETRDETAADVILGSYEELSEANEAHAEATATLESAQVAEVGARHEVDEVMNKIREALAE